MINIKNLTHKKYYLAGAFILTIFFFQCLYFAWRTGQTTDETYFNASGYSMVRYNNYTMLGEHPPLMMQLGALPLLFLQPKFPIDNPILLPDSKNVDLSKTGAKFLYQMGNSPHLILFMERIPIILVGLLLGIVLFNWSFQILGAASALLALIFYCFSPDIIANTSLYATDIGVTAFFFLAVYRIKVFFDSSTIRNGIIAGFSCGLALLTKVSAIVLFPVSLILFVLFTILNKKEIKTASDISARFNICLIIMAILLFGFGLGEKIILATLGPICLITLHLILAEFVNEKKLFRILTKLILWAGWVICFVFVGLIANKRLLMVALGLGLWVFLLLLVYLYFSFKREGVKKETQYLVKIFALIWFIASIVVCLGYTDFISSIFHGGPWKHYLRTFNIATTHSLSGHNKLVEHSWITGDWRYFITSIAAKVPAATLICFTAGLFVLLKSRISKMDKLCVTVPALSFLLVASCLNKIHIGIRHILPVYPFMFMIAGNIVSILKDLKSAKLKQFLTVIFIVLTSWFVYNALSQSPNYLTYANEFVGGPDNAAKLFQGSSFNWGQDNRDFSVFVKERNISSINIHTTANSPEEYDYYGIKWSLMKDKNVQHPAPGYYALDVPVYFAEQENTDSWFRNKEPLYKIGKTIYIFKVE